MQVGLVNMWKHLEKDLLPTFRKNCTLAKSSPPCCEIISYFTWYSCYTKEILKQRPRQTLSNWTSAKDEQLVTQATRVGLSGKDAPSPLAHPCLLFFFPQNERRLGSRQNWSRMPFSEVANFSVYLFSWCWKLTERKHIRNATRASKYKEHGNWNRTRSLDLWKN